MNRRKRNTTFSQALAVGAVSLLFIFTALFGLYKCFSKPPVVENPPPQTAAPGDDNGEPGQDTSQEEPVSNRKESFYTILVGGLDNQNGGSDTNLLVALDAKNGTVHVVSLLETPF